MTKKKQKLSPLVSLAEKAKKSKTFTLGNLGQKWLRKQKLLPFACLAKNDKEKTKLSPLVSLAKNAQIKKLSPLLSLAKNDHEKQTFTFGDLGQKWPRKKNFHH